VLYKKRYISWAGALLGASDVIYYGGQYGCHLEFYQKLEIIKKRRKLEIFNASHVKCDIIKYFAAFCVQFAIFSSKKVKNTQLYPKMA